MKSLTQASERLSASRVAMDLLAATAALPGALWSRLLSPASRESGNGLMDRPRFAMMGNGQMLLPGVAEPHRWDFGPGE